MRKKHPDDARGARVLVLVDESNVGSSVRTAGRGLDWLKLREFLGGPDTGRELIEMVVYAGLPPAIPLWQEERDKKNKFMHWLRSNGFMVVTKDGSPAEEGHYKANVDVMMAIDALELSVEMRPDVVILVTGDADFAYLAIKLRRRGIRVEVARAAVPYLRSHRYPGTTTTSATTATAQTEAIGGSAASAGDFGFKGNQLNWLLLCFVGRANFASQPAGFVFE